MSTNVPASAPNTPTASKRRYIAELLPTERVSGVFAIMNAQLGRTRQDKPFLKVIVSDKTGELPARMWSIDEATFRSLPTDGFAYVEGETQPYQGELQFIIHTINVAEPSAEEMRELLPCAKRDPAEMFAELTALLDTLVHPAMKGLASVYISDQRLMDDFRQAPAAKSMHHAYLGGLLEHTLTLMKLADVVCPLYPKINRDIVLMGLFLHDLGKTRELVYDRTFSYSDRGELIGHIVEGALMLQEKAHALMREHGIRLPPGALTVLQHIVLSHHGIPEYGAAKIPATPEAILVSLLDNVDAKTTMAIAAARPDRVSTFDSGGNFTEKQWALDTKLFRPDVLANK
jgi:3'-5' exoribonuclease